MNFIACPSLSSHYLRFFFRNWIMRINIIHPDAPSSTSVRQQLSSNRCNIAGAGYTFGWLAGLLWVGPVAENKGESRFFCILVLNTDRRQFITQTTTTLQLASTMSGGQPAYSQRHFVKRGGGTWLKLRSFVNAMVKLHGSKVIKHRKKKERRFSSKCFAFRD